MAIITRVGKRMLGVSGESRDYTNQGLFEVPADATESTDLEGLYFHNNNLTSLSESVCNMKQLRVLDLGANQLTSLPARIGNLQHLRVLHLDENKIEAFPEQVCDLRHLKVLHLSGNSLTALSERIGNLSFLEELYLSSNQIALLPEGLGKLARLKVLYLYNNKLKAFPEQICDLAQLRVLHLDDNKITSLPESVCRLSNLKVLHLDNNEIASLPSGIGCLPQLKSLDLYNNRLAALPRSIARLFNIFTLDLRDNPLVDYGEGDMLGRREIASTFGSKVALSPEQAPDRVISEQEVLEELEAMPLRWNTAKLRKISMDKVPEHRLEGCEILSIWRSVLSKYEPRRDDGIDMESYIKAVYGIDRDAFRGQHMYGESVLDARDRIEAVFLYLRDREGDAACDTQAHVAEMCNAIRQSPFRQLSSLNMVYSALHTGKSTSTLECFVENEIAAVKNCIFEMAVTPRAGTQNKYIQCFWKHKLRDRLGFYAEYQTWMDTFGQDIFSGNIGNALHAFYRKFTPRYVIAQVASAINCTEKRLNDTELFLSRRLRCSKYRNRVFSPGGPGGESQDTPGSITPEGVEDILVEMDILVRSTQDT